VGNTIPELEGNGISEAFLRLEGTTGSKRKFPPSSSGSSHYLFGSGFFGFWVLEKNEFPRTLCDKVF
jgi:hypothetical protein